MTSPAAIRRLSESLATGSSDASSGSLPPDLLSQSCRRVGTVALFFAVGWGLSLGIHYLTVWLGGHENLVEPSGFPIPGLPVAGTGLVMSIGMGILAHRLHHRPKLLLDIGLVFEVATAALIAFWNQWVPGVISGDISWVCAIILAYPAIAPSTPAKVMVAAFTAATMDPLWYGIAILRDAAPDPSVGDFLMRFWPNYLCAIGAIVPTKLIRGLGRQVSRARQLGSYRLGERLGAGGMGEVYRAEHRMLARPAAIKLIRPDLLAAVTTHQASMHVERFRREAEAAALLRSPHTIELYDFGFSADGGFYYVMELLDGLSFEDLVSRYGPLSAERAVYLVLQACESIGEAHARGLIHRDLKPSNLYTCRVGLQLDFVKVLDFGLVKGMAIGDATLTAPNIAAGTPAFMAPEVALGEADTNPRLDVYSLGCVLYWLLTGRLVFEGKSPGKIMHLHIAEPPEPPSRRTELPVPPELDALVMDCLSKRPADRPANAEVLRERLHALGLAQDWTREQARRWWDTHRPRSSGPHKPCEGEHVVPALESA